MRRRPKAPTKQFVKGPTNYAGNKIRLLHRILPEFGDLRQHTFVDLFAGGLNVGLNVDANHVVFNDRLPSTASLARLLSAAQPGQLERELEELVARYGLSDSVAHGYAHYGTNSSRGLAAFNRAGFLALRADFNEGRLDDRSREVAQLALIIFGYNNHVQIRARDGFWTNSVGKRDFNSNVRQNLADTVARLNQISHSIFADDFGALELAQFDNPFVYVDPPYSISASTYTRKPTWCDDEDARLFEYLDRLTEDGIPWAMSNLLSHRGRHNEPLTSWIAEREHTVVELDFDYRNVSHNHRSTHRAAGEVLVKPRPRQ